MDRANTWGERILLLKRLTLARPINLVLLLISIFGLVAALYILSTGYLIRPYNDDLNFAARDNLWESIVFWYNWSGRFTSLTIYILSGAFDLPLLSLVPYVSFVLLGGGLYYLLSSMVCASNGSLKNWQGLVITLSIVFPVLLFFIVPYSYASMFWFAAVPLHSWSYGLSLFFFGYLIRIKIRNRRPSAIHRLLEFFAVLVFAMFGEYATLLAMGGLVVMPLLLKADLRKYVKRIWHMAAALVVGMYALMFAPGVITRNQVLESTPKVGVVDAVQATLIHAHTLLVSFSNHSKLLLILLLGGMMVALVWRKATLLSVKSAAVMAALAMLIASIVVLSDIFLPLYAYRDPTLLLYRAMLPAAMAVIAVTMLLGWIIGNLSLRSSFVRESTTFFGGLTLGMMLGLALVSVPHYFQVARDFKAFYANRADIYDRRESYIKAQSSMPTPCTLYVDDAPLNAPQENSDISVDPQGWQNQSLRGYLKSPCDLVRKSES